MIAQLVFVVMGNPSAKPPSAVLRVFNRAKFKESAAQFAMVKIFLFGFISFYWQKIKPIVFFLCVCDR